MAPIESGRTMLIRGVFGSFDVKMPPIRKRMIKGIMVPTIGSTTRYFNQRNRRVSIEVVQSMENGVVVGAAAKETFSPEANVLQDNDRVIVRFFRSAKDEKDAANFEQRNRDDDQSFSTVGDERGLTRDDRAEKIWQEHSQFRFDDVEILKVHKNVIEVKLGAGSDAIIRDLKFESADHASKFVGIMEQTKKMNHERAQRQLASYRGSKETGGDVAINKNMVESPRDLTDIVEADEDNASISILIEIVSANNLPISDLISADPYVVVHMNGKKIHRTKAISKNLDPIWTLDTGSLFLLQMSPDDFFRASSGMLFVVKDFDTLGSNDVLGKVTITLDELLKGTGQRVGYDLITKKPGTQSTVSPKQLDQHIVVAEKTSKAVLDKNKNTIQSLNPKAKKESSKNDSVPKKTPILFLRIKPASHDDIAFMEAYQSKSTHFGLYAPETYVPIRLQNGKHSILRRQVKKGPNNESLLRVRPGPDPDRPEDETKWLSKEQLQAEADKGSTNWIETGSGKIGKLYFELIGCDNLPNMDALTFNPKEKTDAFANVVFEDCIVNTEVIPDCLSPRWPPWTQRAFIFNISYPSSDIYLGVFDHDPERSPLQQLSRSISEIHDSIGRVVVKCDKLVPSTTYTLNFPLYRGELLQHRTKTRGTITLRLRVEYPDLRAAMLEGLQVPHQNVVSVARKIDYQVSKYTTDGLSDDYPFSLGTLTGYIEELESHENLIVVVKAAIMTVWLWRGHYQVALGGKRFTLPLHSITAFLWGVAVTWNWNLLPAFLVFSVGWILLACNEMVNKHPSRWHRCPSFTSMARRLFFNNVVPETIGANANIDEIMSYNELIKSRRERVALEKQKEAEHDLKLQQELGEGIENAEKAEEIGKYGGIFKNISINPLKPVLYPVQKELRKLVHWIRIAKNIFLWNESYYAFWLVAVCMSTSIVFIFIPFGFIMLWSFRILAWILLGPWNVILDRVYFKPNPNMTDSELDEALRLRMKSRYDAFLKSSTNYFIRRENSLKMNSMAQFMFGKYLLKVPRFCEDLYEDYPLDSSFCAPFNHQPIIAKERKFGQRLVGEMIPQREIQCMRKSSTSTKVKKRKGFRVRAGRSTELTPSLDRIPNESGLSQ